MDDVLDGEMSDLGNFVVHWVESRRSGRSIHYRTGSRRQTDSAHANISQNLLADVQIGSVSVTLFGDPELASGQDVERATDLAEAAAYASLHLWPRENPTIEFQLYQHPAVAPITYTWSEQRRADDPWILRFSEVAYDGSSLETRARRVRAFTHELYHLLIDASGRGTRDPRAERRRDAALFYEEIGAFFYSQCASLHSVGVATARGIPNAVLGAPNEAESAIRAPYSDAFLRRFLDFVELGHTPDGEPFPVFVYLGFNLTAWSELSHGQWEIRRGTLEAEALLELCRYGVEDPFRFEAWFNAIADDGRPASPFNGD